MKTEFNNTNVTKNNETVQTNTIVKAKKASDVSNTTGDTEIRKTEKTEKTENSETPYEPKDELKQAIEDANKRLSIVGRELRYTVHEKTKQLLIKIVDSKSDEVILEIPREKSLDNLARVLELSGVFIDEKR